MLSGSSSSSSKEVRMEDKINTYLNNASLKILDLHNIRARKDMKDYTPFDIVAIQECEQMNGLVETIKFSLEDLLRGLKGELNITDAMEQLQIDLILARVPKRWGIYASLKNLPSWYNDLLLRIEQIIKWTDLFSTPSIPLPNSVWISGLFNPLKFLTACQQTIARKRILPLDDMAIITIVTEFKTSDDAKLEENECAFIHGLFLEGADWEYKSERGEG